MSTHRDAVFGKTPEGAVMYCIHCERTYPFGEYRTVKDPVGYGTLQMCPYEDCSGDAVLDAKDWDWVKGYNPSYPEHPKRDTVYPLHG